MSNLNRRETKRSGNEVWLAERSRELYDLHKISSALTSEHAPACELLTGDAIFRRCDCPRASVEAGAR